MFWKISLSFARLNVMPTINHGLSSNVRSTTRKLVEQSSCSSYCLQPKRYSTFFTEVSATELWKGVTGVSNAGKKKGRGKRVGRKKVTDLNRGQQLGQGAANYLWPGLNTNVGVGRERLHIRQLPPDPERSQEVIKLRDQLSRIRYNTIPPLLRGYTGNRFPGTSIGPPDPIADYSFDGFDTRILEFKMVSNMTGTLGRTMSYSAFVVTGNKNGLAVNYFNEVNAINLQPYPYKIKIKPLKFKGYGLGRAKTGKAAIRVAKNRAAQRLVHVPRFNDHTVFHNMFSQFHRSKIFIHKKQEGYGLRCHRILKTISELMGLKNLHCKVENSTKNVQCLTKAFFNAVMHQETHSALADRMGYHVVEYRDETDNRPVIVASPTTAVTKEKLEDEVEDLEVSFERLYYGGKCELEKPKKRWFYENFESHKKKSARDHSMRNQPQLQILRKADLW